MLTTRHIPHVEDRTNMAHMILLLGGARSGKSTLAEQWAEQHGGDSVLFVATAEIGDEEMQRRVEAHRRARPPSWRTLEAPRHVGRALRAAYQGEQAIIVDCLTLLVSNILLEQNNTNAETVAAAVEEEIAELVTTLRSLPATSILVSNEVGMGIVPPTPLGRLYRDVLGTVNQRVASKADEVYLLVAGIPVQIK